MDGNEVYCRYIDGIFSPTEVEAMTGVSPLLQRTWRRRGFLGDRKYGRASFNAHEVAQIMALKIAAQKLNADLKFVHEAVSEAAATILYFALSHKNAWEVEGTREQKAAFMRAIAAENLRGLYYLDKMVGARRERLARFLVRRPADWIFAVDLNDLFDDEEISGALVLDLMEIGHKIAESPQRPRALIIATDIEIAGHPPVLAPSNKRH